MCVSGSYPAPGQLVPPLAVPNVSAASSWLSPTIGGRNIGPVLYRATLSFACARNSGVKSIKSSGTLTYCLAYAGGLVGNGCVGDVFSPGTSDCGTGRSSIGQTGSPVTRSKTYVKPCFVTWATVLIDLPATVTSRRTGAEAVSKSQMSW